MTREKKRDGAADVARTRRRFKTDAYVTLSSYALRFVVHYQTTTFGTYRYVMVPTFNRRLT